MADEAGGVVGFGWALLLIVLVLALIPMMVTFDIANSLFHNVYAAFYSVIYVFLNAAGVDPFSKYVLAIQPFSYNFDLLTTLVAIDGLIRIILIGFVIGVLVQMLSSLDIRSRLEHIRAKRLYGHVIVAGYSDLAENLCRSLKDKKTDFVVIDKNLETIETLLGLGYKTIRGNFTNGEDLKEARIDTADSIVFTSDNDYENLLGIVTAHFLNKKVRIVSRAIHEESVTKMHRAGASLCVVPEILAGVDIGEYAINTGYVEANKPKWKGVS